MTKEELVALVIGVCARDDEPTLITLGTIITELLNGDYEIDTFRDDFLRWEDEYRNESGRPKTLYEIYTNPSKYFRCEHRHCKRWCVVVEGSRGPKKRFCPSPSGGESLCGRKERYYRAKEWQLKEKDNG